MEHLYFWLQKLYEFDTKCQKETGNIVIKRKII